MSATTESRWVTAVRTLNTWKRGNTRAFHKPLFTLLLIARAQAGCKPSVSYEEVREPLTMLLIEFGPPRKSQHPENPFWHLRSDGFWVVENAEAIPQKKDGRSISSSALLSVGARGHVPKDLWDELLENPSLRSALAESILADYWPESLHQSIRDAVGLSCETTTQSPRKQRDPNFREAVLRAYERRCAICGYDGRLGNSPLGIEAAHIQWHAYDGPDAIENGLALCAFHHLALDKGAIGISRTSAILVSTDVNGNDEAANLLFRFAGLSLRAPQSVYPRPGSEYVEWHAQEVFKGPARQCTSELLAVAEQYGEYETK